MKGIWLMLSALVAVFNLQAQKSAVFLTDGAAIHGFDPVAYFTASKPVKGDKQYTLRWNDADWYFSSKQNFDSFKADPAKYAPQFGGYCAYGMADGHKAPTDPDAWSIVEDKLYLNYSKNVQLLWKKNQEKYIQVANSNWLKLKDKE